MKFLAALLTLSSVTAFANGHGDRIKCYKTPQQTGAQKVAFVFKVWDDKIKLIYPQKMPLQQAEVEAEPGFPGGLCLIPERSGSFIACEAQGQQIRGLVPVDVGYEQEYVTVYCQKAISDWI
jgi:hypothetical protein